VAYPLLLSAGQYSALKDLRGVPGYAALQDALETMTLYANETLIRSDERSEYHRGRIDAFTQAHDLIDTIIHTVEDTKHARRPAARDTDPARHWGSPAFRSEFRGPGA